MNKKVFLFFVGITIAFSTLAENVQQKIIPVKTSSGKEFPVYFKEGLPLDAAKARYTGFKQETVILKKGTIRREGAKPLTCDILLERDVPIKLRDGVTIYADIFRPVDNEKHPSIMAWSPYGKEYGGQWLDDVPFRSGVPLSATSQLEKFEAPDPAYWVQQGYTIINPDSRGAYNSEGNLVYWGTQNAEDGYDVIEWAAKQNWSNEKIGMSGNSWLSVSQWFIAAQKPPHLAAIAPWEGFSDHFREAGNRGGIPMPEFPEMIIDTFASNGLIENQPRMIVDYPLMNDYWLDKKANLSKIDIPAYVVASYTNVAHTHGTFAGYRGIASKEKWLRVNNTNEWQDYYTPENVADLTKFFDHYLKGINNGWESTPKVRLSVLNPGGKDIVNRIENEFPLARTKYEKLYLDTSNNTLNNKISNKISSTEYNSESQNNKKTFTIKFDKDTEITGYMKLRVWVSALDNNDMDLAIKVEKLSKDGKELRDLHTGGSIAATGYLRASMRKTDPKLSTESEPFYTFDEVQPLKKGEIVPLDIEIWPMGMFYSSGESLQLTISAYEPPTEKIPFGSSKIDVPKNSYTYTPGEKVEMVTIGGNADQVANEKDVVKSPKTHNKGIHRFYSGGKYDSYLYVPIIPSK